MWFWFISGVMWVFAISAMIAGANVLYVFFKCRRETAKSFEFAKEYIPNVDDCKGELRRLIDLLNDEKRECIEVMRMAARLAEENGIRYTRDDLKDEAFIKKVLKIHGEKSANKSGFSTNEASSNEAPKKELKKGLIIGALEFAQDQKSKLRDDGAQVMISFNDPTRFTFLLPSGTYSGGIPTGFVLPRTTWRSVRYVSNECVIAITNPDDRNFCGVGVYDVKKENFIWATNYRVEAGGCVTDAIPTDASMSRFRIIYTRANGMSSSTLIP